MKSHIPLNQITEWMDRECEPETAGLVEKHLDSCESCRQLAAEMASVDELFRATEKLDLPAHIWTRLEAQLDEERAPLLAGIRHFLRLPGLPSLWRPIHALAALAVCAALVIGSGVYLLHNLSPDRELKLALAEMDRAHSALASLNDQFNPFSQSAVLDSGINPFTVRTLDIDHNPFQSALISR